MRKYRKFINIASLVLAALIYLGTKSSVFTDSKQPPAADSSFYTVSRVIDGDTIALSDGRKIRFIGVDTPEVYYSEKLLRDSKKSGRDVKTIQALGRRSSAFTKDLCLGKKVRLEYDVERSDRYKRTLAYVYLEDGTFVNQKLVQEGLAQVLTVPPNVKYADSFLRSQEEARENNRGLWKT